LRVVAVAALMAGGGAMPAAEATKPAKPVAGAKPFGKSARRAPVEPNLAQAPPEQIDAAGRVYYGAYECEFNQSVTIAKSEKHAAYVDVRSGKSTWLMKPVLSTTRGAPRGRQRRDADGADRHQVDAAQRQDRAPHRRRVRQRTAARVDR